MNSYTPTPEHLARLATARGNEKNSYTRPSPYNLQRAMEAKDDAVFFSGTGTDMPAPKAADAPRPGVVNLTPHPITLITPDGLRQCYPPESVPARVDEKTKQLRTCHYTGVPVMFSELGDVTGLPPWLPNTIYIVSRIVASAYPDRTDIFYPTDFVRDDTGRIIGARALGKM